MAFSIDGLVSGFNTASIIDGLVAIQQRQVSLLTERKVAVAQKQTAFRGIEARLATLRASMSRLNRSVGPVFDSRSATSSDESLIDVAASSGAQPGAFSIRVNSLAAAHQTGSQGFASPTASVTTGTFEIRTGNRQAETFTVDGTNNTLESVASAINAQSSQVSASIIRDSSSGEYRLLLASKFTGSDNAITVTNNLAADNNGAIQPDFTNIQVQAASNASISIGSGPGAITSEYQTNRVEDLVEGVTLNLLDADPGKTVNISVQKDDSAVVEAVSAFVDDYNSIIEYLNNQTSFTSETGAAGQLLGNRSVAAIRNTLEDIITSSVPGATGNLRRLSQVGISIGDKGQLNFDESKLNKILSGDEPGIDPAEVRKLFGLNANSSSSGIQYVLGTSRTGTPASPIEVDITQAATQASVSSSTALASSIVIDDQNREFSFTLDGRESGTLLLSEGTYTQEELATHIQSVVNNATSLAGRQVKVTVNGGNLQITSEAYGKNSTLGSFSGTALGDLGLTGSETSTGLDVAGQFIIDGKIETAKGNGRLLIGDLDNEFTADLQVRVTLGDSQVHSGVEGTLELSRGITSRLDKSIGDLLDIEKGLLSTVNKQFEQQIGTFDTSIKRIEAVTAAKREYLTLQFANLERVLGELQTTSSILAGQLGSINQ